MMELSVLEIVIMFIILIHYHWVELIKSLHHTGLMLTLEELDEYTIVRPLILVSLLEQPVK